MQSNAFFKDLAESDIREIRSRAIQKYYKTGELVFSEGDPVDYFYIVESGSFSIYFDKYGKREEIGTLVSGDHFGEMAIFNRNKRLASVVALEDAEVLAIDKDIFLQLFSIHPAIAEKINTLVAKRNEELILKESLIDTTGLNSDKLHVSIKGDPSLRESAFSRQRHESIVDKILPQLVSSLEDLLLHRSVYKVFLAFNSGEIRLNSVFDPFREEIHPAHKLLDTSYIERHFPLIDYENKKNLVQGMYQFVMNDQQFTVLPEHWKNFYRRTHKNWQPVDRQDIKNVLRKLPELRDIQSFYLRNFSISMVHDVIRMQFNCDGTHIVSAKDYQQFLQENLEMSE